MWTPSSKQTAMIMLLHAATHVKHDAVAVIELIRLIRLLKQDRESARVTWPM